MGLNEASARRSQPIRGVRAHRAGTGAAHPRRRSATASRRRGRSGGDVADDGAARRESERPPARTGRPDRGCRRWRLRELTEQARI
uniref:Uncharacterized protein n=1 Tax=Oryza glumipatula TaxID=40148 RepID=A0A0D9ZRA0_9ORYZ